jgi:hypothetical protein
MKIDWKVIFEAIKEPLREIVLAILPILMVYINAIDAGWAAVLYLVLRFLDKYLHEAWTVNKKTGSELGIVRF